MHKYRIKWNFFFNLRNFYFFKNTFVISFVTGECFASPIAKNVTVTLYNHDYVMMMCECPLYHKCDVIAMSW